MWLVLLGLIAGIGDGGFVETAGLSGVADPATVGRGAAFADLDGDGVPELLVANVMAPNRIYVSIGSGATPVFEDRAGAWGLSGTVRPTFAVVPADIDNDGDLDLFFGNGGFSFPAENRLYLNEMGRWGFVDISNSSGIGADPATTFSAAWADYNGDGRLDLFVANRAYPDRLYRNVDGRRFEEVGSAAGVADGGNAVSCAWFDYDQDGAPDLFVSRVGQSNLLYRNNGDGTFVDVSDQSGVDQPVLSFSCVAGDFDENGWTDLCVGPWAQGGGERVHLYLNFRGVFVDAAVESGIDLEGAVLSLQTQDLDGDGDLDLMVGAGQPASAELDYVFRNDLDRLTRRLRWTDVSVEWGFRSVAPVRSHGIAVGDVDRDGRLDVLVGAGGIGAGEPNRLFLNRMKTAPLVRVTLDGYLSNRQGVGARVLGAAGGASIDRALSAGSGFGSSNEPVLYLPARFLSSLLVMWPGGHAQWVRVPAGIRDVAIPERPGWASRPMHDGLRGD